MAEKLAPTDAWDREVRRRSFFPLTFPLAVGPGSLSIAITIGAGISTQVAAGAMEVVSDLIGIAIVALSVSLSYRFAGRLISWVGDVGTTVFLRLCSFILLCVGVSIMWGGLADLIRGVMSPG